VVANSHPILRIIETLLLFEVDNPESDRIAFFSVRYSEIEPLCVSRTVRVRHHFKVIDSLAVFDNNEEVSRLEVTLKSGILFRAVIEFTYVLSKKIVIVCLIDIP
jgi:hypothetical protein